jgi:hypothetical protein
LKKELEEQLNLIFKNLLTARENPKPSQKFFNFLNSSFFVTVLGGLFICLVSLKIQFEISRAQDERQRVAAIQNVKYEAIQQFSEGICKYLQLSIGWRKRDIWIHNNKENKNRSKLFYTDDNNYKETFQLYYSLRKDFDNIISADALCARTKVLFKDQSISDSINRLDTLLDTYITTYDSTILKETRLKAIPLYQNIIEMLCNNYMSN